MSFTESCINEEITHLNTQIKVLQERLSLPHDTNDTVAKVLEFYTKDNFLIQEGKVMECKSRGDLTFLIAPAGTLAKECLSSIKKEDCDLELYETLSFYAHNYLTIELNSNTIIEAWDDGFCGISRKPGFHARVALVNYKKKLLSHDKNKSSSC